MRGLALLAAAGCQFHAILVVLRAQGIVGGADGDLLLVLSCMYERMVDGLGGGIVESVGCTYDI